MTSRILEATARILVVDPDLGAHLRASIRTGTTCAYEPARRVAWRSRPTTERCVVPSKSGAPRPSTTGTRWRRNSSTLGGTPDGSSTFPRERLRSPRKQRSSEVLAQASSTTRERMHRLQTRKRRRSIKWEPLRRAQAPASWPERSRFPSQPSRRTPNWHRTGSFPSQP